MNNSITTTKSSGFSLIELLVVVAILGVVAAIGTVSYSGYVSSTERKSAENLMRQVALGQTEYYSENGIYFSNSGCGATAATVAHSKVIESDLNPYWGQVFEFGGELDYIMENDIISIRKFNTYIMVRF